MVHDKAVAGLGGKASRVAAGIRRAATRRGADPPKLAGRHLRHLPASHRQCPLDGAACSGEPKFAVARVLAVLTAVTKTTAV